MSIHVITAFHAKPDQADDLIALLVRSIPDSRAHEGCEDISIRQDQDDPAHVLSLTTWTTRRHYEEYLAWRTDMGDTAIFEALLDQPMSISYLSDISFS
jgi:quinol monooxygenase YgiN